MVATTTTLATPPFVASKDERRLARGPALAPKPVEDTCLSKSASADIQAAIAAAGMSKNDVAYTQI